MDIRVIAGYFRDFAKVVLRLIEKLYYGGIGVSVRTDVPWVCLSLADPFPDRAAPFKVQSPENADPGALA